MTVAAILVVGAGREADGLRRAVRALERQTRRPDQVVVVLNGAHVDTVPASSLELTVVELSRDRGCSPGRNVGADACSADIVLFSDDDGELAPSAVAAVADAFARASAEVAGVAGFVLSEPGVSGPSPKPARPIFRFSGGVCALRRDAFLAAGKWPAESGRGLGDEFDLAMRLWRRGQVIESLPGLVLYHPPRHGSDFGEVAVANNARLVAVYFEHFPLPIAVAAVAKKLVRDTVQLLGRGELSRAGELTLACVAASRRGLSRRRPLSWREFRTVRALESAAPSTRHGV